MPRGMELVAGRVWRMRGRRFITAAGIGGAGMRCRMGMELGWGMGGMDGWMRMIQATTQGMTPDTIRGTARTTETTGRTMLGLIRMGWA